MGIRISPLWGFFIGGTIMSWYKRRPRVKEPLASAPKHFSPMGDKAIKERQDAMRGTDDGTTTTPHVSGMATRK